MNQMRAPKWLVFIVIVWRLSSPWPVIATQDPDLQTRYEQALQAAEVKSYDRAYDLAVKLVRANMVFYKANVLRIALASILKKSGTETPQVLLSVLKRQAPAGSDPERDVQALVTRLTGVTSGTVQAPANNTESPQPTSKPVKDTTPPKLLITSPSLTRGIGARPTANQVLKQPGSTTTITGQATDESGVREVNINGAAVQLDERGNFSAKISLQFGDNPITVTAADVYGNRATESFNLRRESDAPAGNGRYFALLIGNNRYPYLAANRQLNTAINDAQEVAKLLVSDYGFEIKLLKDAKRGEIIGALNEYRRTLRPDDKLLIYYAGHGHFDNETNKAYWLPADAEESNTANWIIADEVTTSVRPIPARHILIVSDSCYSGALTRSIPDRLNTPAERERYLEKMGNGTARILMASGGNEPVADGGGSGHSVFARALLDGLRGMREQVYTAEELFHEYIKERVAGKAEQTPDYIKLPNSGHESGDFVFVRRRP